VKQTVPPAASLRTRSALNISNTLSTVLRGATAVVSTVIQLNEDRVCMLVVVTTPLMVFGITIAERLRSCVGLPIIAALIILLTIDTL
jgi:hypothetical protein